MLRCSSKSRSEAIIIAAREQGCNDDDDSNVNVYSNRAGEVFPMWAFRLRAAVLMDYLMLSSPHSDILQRADPPVVNRDTNRRLTRPV